MIYYYMKTNVHVLYFESVIDPFPRSLETKLLRRYLNTRNKIGMLCNVIKNLCLD